MVEQIKLLVSKSVEIVYHFIGADPSPSLDEKENVFDIAEDVLDNWNRIYFEWAAMQKKIAEMCGGQNVP